MTPAKQPPVPRPVPIELEAVADRHYVAHFRRRTYRYLLSDGSLVDVEAPWDSSDLRTRVRETVSAETGKDLAIEGVVAMPDTGW